MFKILLTFFRSHSTTILIAAIGLLVSGIAYGVYDYGKIREKNQALLDERDRLELSLAHHQKEMERQAQELHRLGEKNAKAEESLRHLMSQTNALRRLTREEVKANQPEIERQINQNFQNIQNQLSCVTGDKSKC